MTTETPSSADLVRRIDSLRREQQEDRDQFELRKHNRAAEIQQLEHQLYLRGRGVDFAQFRRGRAMFVICDAREALLPDLARDAMSDLASGTPRLLREYFGCKDYEHWRGQRSDHPYGTGPRHGHIVASIGLSDEVRRDTALLREHLEDALYFLAVLVGGTHPRLAPTHAGGSG